MPSVPGLEHFQPDFARTLRRISSKSREQTAPETEAVEQVADDSERGGLQRANEPTLPNERERLPQNGEGVREQWQMIGVMHPIRRRY